MFSIRKATLNDLPAMMEAYVAAQNYMMESGNLNQWPKGFPPEDFIRDEILRNVSYVVLDEDGILEGAFSLIPGEDPTYGYVEGGQWLNDEPYCTIHKLASMQRKKGIFNAVISFARSLFDNVRADTHADNATMQHLFLKAGFRKVGIIYLLNGEPRIAFHLTKQA